MRNPAFFCCCSLAIRPLHLIFAGDTIAMKHIIPLLLMLAAFTGVNAQTRTYIDTSQRNSITESMPFDLPTSTPTASHVGIEARAAMSRHTSQWGIAAGLDSAACGVMVIVKRITADRGWIAERAALNVAYGHYCDGVFTPTDSVTVDAEVSPEGGANTLALDWAPAADGTPTLTICIGNHGLRSVMHVKSPMPTHPACRIIADGEIRLDGIITEITPDKATELATSWTADSIKVLIEASAGGITGIWHYLDRRNDPDYARPGGTYTLAIVPADKTGHYLILYCSGAEVNAGAWHTGMIKGKLKPNPFANQWDMVWIDSMLDAVCDESYLTLDSNGVATLHFPLLKTEIRMYKE